MVGGGGGGGCCGDGRSLVVSHSISISSEV